MAIDSLTKRTVKGSPLTPDEGDQNLTILEDAVNAILARLDLILTPAGQLKNNPFQQATADTGTANSIIVTVGSTITAYSDLQGSIIYLVPSNTCTGATTLQVNTLSTPPEIVKNANQSLQAGDIIANVGIFVSYSSSDGKFHLMGTARGLSGVTAGSYATPSSITVDGMGRVTSVTAGTAKRFAGGEITITAGAFTAGSQAHTLGAKPDSVYAVLVCQSDDGGFTAGMELDANAAVSQFREGGSWRTDVGAPPAFKIYADATNVYYSFPAWSDGSSVPATGTLCVIRNVTDGSIHPIDFSKWKLKIYASYL